MNINAPFEIGQTMWLARTNATKERLECPCCLGTGIVVILYGGTEAVSMPCEACALGFGSPRGFIEEWLHTPGAAAFTIEGVKSFSDGRWMVSDDNGSTVDYAELFRTEAEALAHSMARMKALEEENMQRRQHRRGNVKKVAWSARYHKQQIAELQRQLAWHEARLTAHSLKEAK